MDRVQLLLVGLPLFLFASDVIHLFSGPPPQPRQHQQPPLPRHVPPPPVIDSPLEFPTSRESQYKDIGLGIGSSVHIDFCASCSYRWFGSYWLSSLLVFMTMISDGEEKANRLFHGNETDAFLVVKQRGTALTMKKMLETSFPGINVVLSNHPATLPKRLLSKVVPVIQMGVIAIIVAGEQIFPRLGYVAPPPWFYSLRANKFGSIASTWLLGNVVQSFLQSSGAFEVYCNGDLVFSKLSLQRFPGEIELRDLISKKLTASNSGGAGAM